MAALSHRDLTLRVISRGYLTASDSISAVVIGGDLGLYAATVWCMSNLWKEWSNRFNKAKLDRWSSVLQGRLNDIVCKGITKQTFDLLAWNDLFDNHVFRLRLGTAQALLNHVGRKLVTRKLANATLEHCNQRLCEYWLVEINDVLNHVVTEGVLDKDTSMLSDTLHKPQLLVPRCVINTALKNTAAMSMSTNGDAMSANSIKNKLRIRRHQLVQTLLNNMVAIQVLDKLNNTEAQSFNDKVNLLRRVHEFDHFLERTCTVLIERNAHHVLGCILNQDSAFVIIAVLKELLAQVIAKGVRHKFDDMLVGLEPNGMNLVRDSLFKLLLQIAAPMLVLTELVNLTSE